MEISGAELNRALLERLSPQARARRDAIAHRFAAKRSRKVLAHCVTGGPAPGCEATSINFVNSALRVQVVPIGLMSGFEMLMNTRPEELVPDVHYKRYSSRRLPRAGIGLEIGTTRNSPLKRDFSWKDFGDPASLAQVEMLTNGLLALGISGIASIGGDGSLAQAVRLWLCGLPIVLLPKSVDDDYGLTSFALREHSFGVETCARIVSEGVTSAVLDAQSERRFIFYQVMGRFSGALAALATVSATQVVGPNVIMLSNEMINPTKSLDDICGGLAERMIEREQRGYPYGVIVLSENIGLAFAKNRWATVSYDQMNQPQVGKLEIARLIAEKTWSIFTEKRSALPARPIQGREVTSYRSIRADFRERMSAQLSPMDAALCTVIGQNAVEVLSSGVDGCLVWASMADQEIGLTAFGELVDFDTLAPKKRELSLLGGLGRAVLRLNYEATYLS